MLLDISFAIAAYLLGSISSAIVICRLLGLPDPREQGSGNPGATNVLRYGGKKAAAAVFLGDMLKGLLPVLGARWLELPAATIAAVGLLAFAGHIWPVFFRFRGGKGVATAFGVLSGWAWLPAAVLAAIWIGVAAASRISSLGAISAALCAPLVIWAMQDQPVYAYATVLMSVVLLWRHRSNLRNLLRGAEPRIGQKK
jgi:glycerol-3-phosphate acyltransferase PlsY